MVTTHLCTVLLMLVVGTQALGYYGGPPPLTPVAFPLMPATPFAGGFGGGYMPRQQQVQQIPDTLTCIAKDMSDPNSQIRLTVSGSRGARGGYNPGFGGFDDDDFDDFDFDDDFNGGFFGGFGGGMGGGGGGGDEDDRSREYRLDGTFIPSISIDKSGTYQVVVTTYGRTADGCSADALGPIFNKQRMSGGGQQGFGSAFGGGFGPGMGFGGMGGYGMGGGFGGLGGFGGGMGMGMGMSPFMGPYSPNMYNTGGFWNQGGGMQQQQQQQIAPSGQLHNPAIVGGSATIYSAHVNRISKNELLGRAIALCPRVSNNRCEGYIPYCCTITRDSLPAMELFVQSNSADSDDGRFGGMSGFPVNGNNPSNLQSGISLGGGGGNINGGGLGGGPGLF